MQVIQNNIESVNQCDLCGSSNLQPEISVQTWNLVRCGKCRLVFTSPRFSEGYCRQRYEHNYYEKSLNYFSSQLEKPSEDENRLAQSMQRQLKSQVGIRRLRSIDIGCGAGRIVQAFQNNGWEAMGLDLSKKAIDTGVGRGLDLRRTSLEDPSLGLFDLITCFHVLEHMHRPGNFLGQVAASLVAGGYFLVEVPNYGSRIAMRMGKNWPYLYPDLHLYQFTIDTAKEYLRRSGFSILLLERVHGKGPLELHSPKEDQPERWRDIKKSLFALRHIIYWSPFLKRLTRHLFWNTLGFGECIRILARKGDCR